MNTPETRDEKLRASILTGARLAGTDYAAATILVDGARDDDFRGVDGDEHASRLLGDLLALGLIEEQPNIHLGTRATALRHRRFRLSKKGWALWMGDIPPVPGVWDERLDY